MTDFAPLMPTSYYQWSEVNALGLTITLDGKSYAAKSATWTESSHGAVDALTVVVPLSTNPDFPTQLFRGTPNLSQSDLAADEASGIVTPAQIAQWSAAAAADVTIELYVGFPQSPVVGVTPVEQLTRFFLGEVDTYSGQFDADTVTFAARSLGAHLVDDVLSTVSLNQTMALFLNGLAGKYKLPTPIINLASGVTPVTVQEVLAYDQVGGSGLHSVGNAQASLYNMHPMDLAIRAAQIDDADVWVNSRTGEINYVSASLAHPGTPIDFMYGRDWKALGASHSPQFSKNIEVVGYTHQPRTRITTTVHLVDDGLGNTTQTVSSSSATSQAVLGTNQTISTSTTTNASTGNTTTSSSTGSSSGGNATIASKQGASESAIQRYNLYLGNMDAAKAITAVQAYRRQITQQEYQLVGNVPITRRLLSQISIEMCMRVHGNPWGLTNAVYFPRKIEYVASTDEGFHATITSLSHAPASSGV